MIKHVKLIQSGELNWNKIKHSESLYRDSVEDQFLKLEQRNDNHETNGIICIDRCRIQIPRRKTEI